MTIRRLLILSLLLAAACRSASVQQEPTRPVAYVSAEGGFVLVRAADRALAAELLEVKSAADAIWVAPLPSGDSLRLEVIEVNAIPAEFSNAAISASSQPIVRMRCVVTAPAREECKNLGPSSAYIWYKPVRECQPGDINDSCTPLVNKPIAHFDVYRTNNCTGTPVRKQVVVPGDSCR